MQTILELFKFLVSGQIAAVWIHAKYQADGSKVQHYGFYDITEAFSFTMTKDVRFLGG